MACKFYVLVIVAGVLRICRRRRPLNIPKGPRIFYWWQLGSSRGHPDGGNDKPIQVYHIYIYHTYVRCMRCHARSPKSLRAHTRTSAFCIACDSYVLYSFSFLLVDVFIYTFVSACWCLYLFTVALLGPVRWSHIYSVLTNIIAS